MPVIGPITLGGFYGGALTVRYRSVEVPGLEAILGIYQSIDVSKWTGKAVPTKYVPQGFKLPTYIWPLDDSYENVDQKWIVLPSVTDPVSHVTLYGDDIEAALRRMYDEHHHVHYTDPDHDFYVMIDLFESGRLQHTRIWGIQLQISKIDKPPGATV